MAEPPIGSFKNRIFLYGTGSKSCFTEKNIGLSRKFRRKGVQIISKDVKIETKCAGWTAHGELILREAAGVLTDSVPDVVEDLRTEDTDGNEE